VNCAALVVALEGGVEVDEGFVEEVCIGVEVELGIGVDEEAGGVDVAGAGVLLAGAC
jgi:hypothetical protein